MDFGPFSHAQAGAGPKGTKRKAPAAPSALGDGSSLRSPFLIGELTDNAPTGIICPHCNGDIFVAKKVIVSFFKRQKQRVQNCHADSPAT